MNFRIDYRHTKKKKSKYKHRPIIAGKHVCITGTLPSMTRSEARNWLLSKSASYSANMTRNVDLLIRGKCKTVTSKELLARKYEIPVYDYEEIKLQ